MGDIDGGESFEERAYRWLASPAAMKQAKNLLARKQIFVDPLDVIADARWNIWAFFQRNPDRAVVSEPAAYCTVVMRHVVADVLNGFKFEPLDEPPTDAGIGLDFAASRSAETTTADRLRSAIETAGHPEWVTAAALNFVTLSAYPACDVSGAPASRAGATPNQARLWPSLWFAGRRDGLFPGSDGGGPAQRKRLSRTGTLVQSLIDEAAHTLSAGAAS